MNLASHSAMNLVSCAQGVSGTSLAFEAHPELQGKCKNLAFDGSAQGATRALKFKVKPNFRIAKKDCNTGAKRRRKSSADATRAPKFKVKPGFREFRDNATRALEFEEETGLSIAKPEGDYN
ncbi:hypothetical protein B0H11DRAFT_1928868 [Mycena galericulata]|nr:hypothetical protein B0H11DRAFT_1928868 [Mycena galericulata]